MTEQPGFEMVAVESSNVEAVGFAEGILAVKFKGGKTYRYKGVPQKFFDKLMAENAAAKGGDKTASVGRVMQMVTKAPDMFPILDVDGKPYEKRGKA